LIDLEWNYLYANENAQKGWDAKDSLLSSSMLHENPELRDTSVYAVIAECMQVGVSKKHIQKMSLYSAM
jgi:hypothetical protein